MALNRTVTGAIIDITRLANGDRDKATRQLQSVCFVAAWAGMITAEDRDRVFELWLKYGKYNLPATCRHTLRRVIRDLIEEGQAMKLQAKPLLPTG
jgi:hypothetical protein